MAPLHRCFKFCTDGKEYEISTTNHWRASEIAASSYQFTRKDNLVQRQKQLHDVNKNGIKLQYQQQQRQRGKIKRNLI